MAHVSRVLTSEWTKVRTVRSTLWTLVAAFVVTVGLGAMICALTRNEFSSMSTRSRLTFDPTYTAFAGMSLGQLAMIAFGVLVVSAEYGTGMIRSSLTAVPQRGTFMVCKIVVAGILVLLVGMATSFVTFFIGQLLLGDHGTDLGEPGVLRAVLGGGFYMTLIMLFSMGFTFVVRSPLLAFAILMPWFFLVANILGSVSATKTFAQYLPDQAGGTIMSVVSDSDRPYGPWEGLLIMAAWTAAALIAGYVVLKERDA